MCAQKLTHGTGSFVCNFVQEIRNSGAIGYKYITVDEDEAANVIYANNVLLHLANELIPRGAAVSDAFLRLFV